ncbi:uncharacterized protein CDV56_107412 [Aspergillus thermomutatus]|uniref:amidase n=1 Tax=Aspergillus thermomutatus TaxID=41047 RepID=A0A397HCK5_ASPTH|nr:uncharacterized protein CDV56_107412 [Aspergillus thermomutatus]RHZ60707.1 hypothetical protein CDV56_107412 [Aspergillus thermomutatus]
MADNWKHAGLRKREAIQALIPPEWLLPSPPAPLEAVDLTDGVIQRYLSPREVTITETGALALLQKLSTGEWSSREVTRAFCHRAALAHQMISCLHEIFFEAALQDAEQCDRYLARHGRPIGPLHGLPVSLKDVVHVKDVATSMGFLGWLDHTYASDDESEIVKILRSLGAVLYVKSAVPTGSFTGETFNSIIGYVPNPRNRFLTVGGSSGGEGGLLALKGSPLGIGTDIGGSVRVPAVWNGLYGLRPSTGRIPLRGVASVVDGQFMIPFVVGFMAPSPEVLTFATRSVLDAQPWVRDPAVVPMPWRADLHSEALQRAKGLSEPMCFGVMMSDGHVNPQPPVCRAMETVIGIIKALGHTRKTVSTDGGKAFHDALGSSGEPSNRVDLDLCGPPRTSSTVFGLKAGRQANATEINGINLEVQKYRTAYLEYWHSTAVITGTGRAVDALIMPVSPGSAPEPGKVRYFGYTTVVNVLDYTSCAVPVGTVDKAVDQYPDELYEPLNDLDRLVHDDYNAEAYHGAPVGAQIVGQRLEEEKVLALAEAIGDELHKRTGCLHLGSKL